MEQGVKLTQEEWTLIIRIVAEQPYRAVAELLAKLNTQLTPKEK